MFRVQRAQLPVKNQKNRGKLYHSSQMTRDPKTIASEENSFLAGNKERIGIFKGVPILTNFNKYE